MGRPPTEDWKSLRKKYLGIRKTGQKLTLKQFAGDMGVGYSAMSKAFKKLGGVKVVNQQTESKSTKKKISKLKKSGRKYDWIKAKEEYFSGHYKTLEEMAKGIGCDPKTGGFTTATRGWRRERDILLAEAHNRAIESMKKNKSVDFQVQHLAFYYNGLEAINDVMAKRKAIAGRIVKPKELKEFFCALNEVAKFLKNAGEQVQKLENNQTITGILEDLLSGTGDVTTAALQLTKMNIVLPEAVKIMLAKTSPSEPEQEEESWGIPLEELDQRLEDGTAVIDHQENVWRLKRKKTVEGIKKAVKAHDSFKPEAA